MKFGVNSGRMLEQQSGPIILKGILIVKFYFPQLEVLLPYHIQWSVKNILIDATEVFAYNPDGNHLDTTDK